MSTGLSGSVVWMMAKPGSFARPLRPTTCVIRLNTFSYARKPCANSSESMPRTPDVYKRQVLNGDAETGVSIMQMDEGLDTGDVLYCKKIAIDPEETSGELFDRVTAVGAEALCETIQMCIRDRCRYPANQCDLRL